MEQKPETGRQATAVVVAATTADLANRKPEPESGHLLLDMTSSTLENRRRRQQRGRSQCDDSSSDADRETALIAHRANSDEIAQLSSDNSCHNCKWAPKYFVFHGKLTK